MGQVLAKNSATNYDTGWITPAAGGGTNTWIGATPPASPVTTQLWWRSDPDQNLYIYYDDGNSKQWVQAVPVPPNLWTVAGGNLQPQDATKKFIVGTPPNDLILPSSGTSTTTARLIKATTNDGIYLASNTSRDAADTVWAQDDATKSSWMLRLSPTADTIDFFRAAAGTTSFINVARIDNVGHLTFKAMACNINNNNVAQTVTASTWTTVNMTSLGYDSSGGVMPIPASSQIKTTPTGGWVIIVCWLTLTAVATAALMLQASPDGSTGWYNINYNAIPTTNQGSIVAMSYSGAPQYFRLQVFTNAGGVQYANMQAIVVAGL